MPDTNSRQTVLQTPFSTAPHRWLACQHTSRRSGAAVLVTTTLILVLTLAHAAVSNPRDARQRRRPQPRLLLLGLGCALFHPRLTTVTDFWPENREPRTWYPAWMTQGLGFFLSGKV